MDCAEPAASLYKAAPASAAATHSTIAASVVITVRFVGNRQPPHEPGVGEQDSGDPSRSRRSYSHRRAGHGPRLRHRAGWVWEISSLSYGADGLAGAAFWGGGSGSVFMSSLRVERMMGSGAPIAFWSPKYSWRTCPFGSTNIRIGTKGRALGLRLASLIKLGLST